MLNGKNKTKKDVKYLPSYMCVHINLSVYFCVCVVCVYIEIIFCVLYVQVYILDVCVHMIFKHS